MTSGERPNVVRARRAVSARELARSTGALLKEVELDEAVFVVGTRGRMVALLMPLPERTLVEVSGSAYGESRDDDVESEFRPEWLELSAVQRDAISMAASAPTGFLSLSGLSSRYDPPTAAIAVSGLELGGFLKRAAGGLRITVGGRAAAEWLKRDLDSRDAAPSS